MCLKMHVYVPLKILGLAIPMHTSTFPHNIFFNRGGPIPRLPLKTAYDACVYMHVCMYSQEFMVFEEPRKIFP